jgi:hypothetical protein
MAIQVYNKAAKEPRYVEILLRSRQMSSRLRELAAWKLLSCRLQPGSEALRLSAIGHGSGPRTTLLDPRHLASP